MTTFFKLNTLILVVATAISGSFAPSAYGQANDQDLQQQNQDLIIQLQKLQHELQLANERNRQLEERVKQLEQQLAAARTPSALTSGSRHEAEKVSIDESVPHASPRALFKAIVASYQQALENLEVGRPGDGKRRAYLRKVENWKAAASREFRNQIHWTVRLIDVRITANGQRVATLVAVDPETDVQLGAPFDVVLSQTLVDRLARYGSQGELGALSLRGTLSPEIRLDQAREERGSFDNPPFIGPFAEFLFRVDVTSLQPVREEQAAPDNTPATDVNSDKPTSSAANP